MSTITKAPKAKKTKPRTRNNYTPEQREKARKYYLLGLNIQEISKLLDGIPVKTLEKWQFSEQWTSLKNCKPVKQRAIEFKQSGKTVKEISEILKISSVTVWRYTKTDPEK
jgi:hypothetical protein